ncbi:MAG: hypothetical protein QMC80_03765 [Thermoplasmatales archaeon]|nr:hypothetical protein [Thermoplasmatales archaeon]
MSRIGGKKLGGKTTKLFIVLVVIMLSALTFYGLYLSVAKWKSGTTPPSPHAALNCSKEGENYTIRIIEMVFPPKPGDVKWCVNTEEGYYITGGVFPTTSGIAGSVTVNSTTVTWFDEDNDDKLSTNDTIRIYKSGNALEGCYFSLYYKTQYVGNVKFQ